MPDQAAFNSAGLVAQNMALVISGPALEDLLQAQRGTAATEALLLSIAKLRSVVVACRLV